MQQARTDTFLRRWCRRLLAMVAAAVFAAALIGTAPALAQGAAPRDRGATTSPPSNLGTLLTALLWISLEAGGANFNQDGAFTYHNGGNLIGQANGGVTSTPALVGGDIRMMLPFLLATTPLAVARIPTHYQERFVFLGPFVGFRARYFFNAYDQVIGTSFHFQSNDTRLSAREFWAAKTYLGLAFLLQSSSWPYAVRLSPYVGLNIQNSGATFSTDETAGGGTLNTLEVTKTQVGPAVGMDIDFLFRNLPFFVGVGFQVDWLKGLSGNLTSTTGRTYHFNTDDRTAVSVFARIGVPIGGAAGNVFASDAWLKRDVALLARRSDGIGLYRFRYHWSDVTYVGTMAQEVQQIAPEAVLRDPAGYLKVDYGAIGLQMMTLERWHSLSPAQREALTL